MREFTIGKNDAGQRLDRFCVKVAPALPSSLLQKYLRLKRIKVNGSKVAANLRLNEGDLIQMYINDEFFELIKEESAYKKIVKPNFTIVYEDENILLIDKRPGIIVHSDEKEKANTLITHIQAYLYQKGEWNPKAENSFAPALCNRIDRNTGGIVIAAKNAEALRIINDKIRCHEIKKHYLCLVFGKMSPLSGKLEGYIFKDSVKNRVYVHSKRIPGSVFAGTIYRTIATGDGLSLVECELITGRTHQLRAQLAHAGYPMLGDGKYGRDDKNKKFGAKHQCLYSYKTVFAFETDAGILNYLKGKEFKVKHVDFAEKFLEKHNHKNR